VADPSDQARPRALAPLRFLLRPEHRREVLHEWRRRRRGEPPLPAPPVARALILCHGNICRSPFAEALLRVRCAHVEVRSAGFAAGDGSPADPTAIEVAQEWSIDLRAHRARLLRPDDLRWADLVLVMTAVQAADAIALGSSPARVRLLGDYLDAPPHVIADPFGQRTPAFRACFGRIDQAVARLSERLKARP
jgi:protein-tyrosine phosphatase